MTEIKNILVPVDFSENSSKIAAVAVYMAEKFKARLTVVYVVESLQDYEGFAIPHISLEQFKEGLQKSAQDKMDDFVEEHLPLSLNYDTKVVIGDVAATINSIAKKGEMDMIVMGTHGYKGLKHALFGSVADKVVKTAPCPVLTVNPNK
jgi:nucleotide-binding universal stress UspA family protein